VSDKADIAVTVAAFIAKAREAAKGGLTVAEFWRLLLDLVALVVGLAESVSAQGTDKKQWVVDAAANLFDAVADKAVPLAAKPAWLVLRPIARAVVLAAAGGAVESILPLVRKASA